LSDFPKLKFSFSLAVLRTLTALVGLLGLGWGFWNLASGEAVGRFWDVETHLLRFESYKRANATDILKSAAARNISPCDTHSQRALLLLEMPLADAALRSGSSRDFELHMQSLEARLRWILRCSPRDSFAWLVAFGLEIEHGVIDEHAFDLLAMSYETSPIEAWIAVRRVLVATPVVLSAPEPVQRKILAEFQDLIRRRFIELPALAYVKSKGPTRLLLRKQIDQLNLSDQKAFSDALEKFGS
jgi:hypothetical protein